MSTEYSLLHPGTYEVLNKEGSASELVQSVSSPPGRNMDKVEGASKCSLLQSRYEVLNKEESASDHMQSVLCSSQEHAKL